MRVAAVQLTSTSDASRNLRAAGALVDGAVNAGAELVALPELFNRWGSAEELRAGAEPLSGPTITWVREQAARHGVWLLAGSIVERVEGSTRHRNTSCLCTPTGEIAACYRKIHLFDVDVDGAAHHESATVVPGDEVVVADAGPLVLGMSICYDLRFPELFRIQALRGATAAVVPSAFTAATGKDHWETLLRARAIENQVFVIAPNQRGQSTPTLSWHGRSMIVDPWGVVMAQAPDAECFVTADLDLDAQREVRKRLPSLANRRTETYVWPAGEARLENEERS
ncbi:MAG: carbon-nitrogen hydrolase family protein [Actinobacteria bacterium]|nr:carbon-nitrogen hydrolase family protein [Actinomycetota bacterium]